VEREQEGFSVGKKEDKLGMRASGTCVLHFDNVKVKKIQSYTIISEFIFYMI